MLQHYRREGGTDDSERESGAGQDDGPRTTTRTEEIDELAGIQTGTDGREQCPAYRQAAIEFVERRYAEDGGVAEPRREELRREGCQIDVQSRDVEWSQQTHG